MGRLFPVFLCASLLPRTAEAVSRKTVTGWPTVIKTACINPPEEAELANRIEYGDKVRISLSAYHENEQKKQEYSPEIATQDIIIGRSNIPALNDFLLGMCKTEIRRVFTWLFPKQQAGPVAYMVELQEILGKGQLQRHGDRTNDGDRDDDDLDVPSYDLGKPRYPRVQNVKLVLSGVTDITLEGDKAAAAGGDKSAEEKTDAIHDTQTATGNDEL